MENGVSLCGQCHNSCHSWSLTQSDFADFLEKFGSSGPPAPRLRRAETVANSRSFRWDIGRLDSEPPRLAASEVLRFPEDSPGSR
jgi:hypothetical protein